MLGREKPATQTRFGLVRLMRQLGMSEVRRTGESETQANRWPSLSGAKAMPAQGRIGWLETECSEVHVRESRIPVLALKGAGQESESS